MRCYKPKEDSDNKDVYSIIGLKYAEATAAQGEKVTLLREPENVSVQQMFNKLPFLSTSLLIQAITPFQKHDPNAVKVVNGSGQLIGHIAKDKAAILSPKIKEIQEDLQSRNLKKLFVEGTIISVSDGYQQSVKVEFKQISNEAKDTEVEVIVLE
eukprot:scaffold17343_cov93-Skeletonema_dohrnii-CCMP3373.AAC.1